MTLIEDLLDLQTPDHVRISPNAQQVVYSTTLPLSHKKGEHEQSTIWLAETGKPKSSRQLTSGLYNDFSPKWNPDGKSITFVSDRAKQGESWAIYMLPVKEGGEAYPLTPVENERDIEDHSWSPDGKFIAYFSADEKTAEKKAKEKDKDDANVWGEDWEYHRLRLLHVGTKKVTSLVSRNANVDDFAWNDDGTKIAFTETRTPDIESQFTHGTQISIVDISTKEIKPICHFSKYIQDLTWAGDSFYFIGPVADNTISADCVYHVDLTAEKPTHVKYAHGDEDCAWDLSKVGKDMSILVQSGMEDQIRMLKGNTIFARKKEIEAWDVKFTTDSDEMILAIVQGDTNSPPEVFTITASGGAMVQLSNHGDAIADKKFGTVNFLTSQSNSVNGEEPVRLDSLFLTPDSHAGEAGKPAKALPTVVWIHGGPYGRITDTFNPAYKMWSSLLLSAGYGLLMVNYRGSSGRGEEFAAYCRGACGTYDYDDIISMTQNAINKGYADKDKLIVAGWSQGGFLSYLSSVRNGLHNNGWRFQAAIPGAGVSDGDTLAFTSDIGSIQNDLTNKSPWKSNKSDISNRTGSAIWEFNAAVEKGDVIPPLLILHGEQDRRVPIEQAVGFRRALEEADLQFEMVTYPREPHVFKERKHLVDVADRVVRFVDMHIGGQQTLALR